MILVFTNNDRNSVGIMEYTIYIYNIYCISTLCTQVQCVPILLYDHQLSYENDYEVGSITIYNYLLLINSYNKHID